MESKSETLQQFLEYISPKFHNSLHCELIGNIVTSVVQNCTAPVQFASDNQSQILHGYHDEMFRFKKSAAVYSATAGYLQGVPKTNSLFQVITDNYDTKQ